MDHFRSPDGRIRELALFAGGGGGLLAGHLLGWQPVCAVEIKPAAVGFLVARQNDQSLPPFPIWDDIRSFDGRAWRGLVEVVSGGFPCQDVSVAGKGDGLDGEHSALWWEMARVVCQVRPPWVWVENSPALTSLGLDEILRELARQRYHATWGVFAASSFGAWHERKRLFLAAYSDHHWQQQQTQAGNKTWLWPRDLRPGNAPCTDRAGLVQQRRAISAQAPDDPAECGGQWPVEPGMVRVVHGMAGRVDRVSALGNGQVPRVAARAWNHLTAHLLQQLNQGARS